MNIVEFTVAKKRMHAISVQNHFVEIELTNHRRTHTDEKPYACAMCPKRFPRRSSLGDHQDTHSSVKKYACTDCQKQFSTNTQLKVHRKNHHRQ